MAVSHSDIFFLKQKQYFIFGCKIFDLLIDLIIQFVDFYHVITSLIFFNQCFFEFVVVCYRTKLLLSLYQVLICQQYLPFDSYWDCCFGQTPCSRLSRSLDWTPSFASSSSSPWPPLHHGGWQEDHQLVSVSPMSAMTEGQEATSWPGEPWSQASQTCRL